MKRLWLFRTNLKSEESYHRYINLEEFENNLWDFYLVQSLWILRNTDCKEVVIWRLTDKPSFNITFDISENKKFIQMFVNNFNECFKFSSPDISFWRGGFKEYDDVIKINPNFFGKKIYLGANGPRRYPIYGTKYDKILIEDEKDLKDNCIPFYKIGPPKIFFPIKDEKKIYDICFPANGSQIKYKGLEYFIFQISKSNLLKKLDIVNCGNQPEVGKKICRKYGIKNIKFIGHLNRQGFNKLLNQSRFGIVASNDLDGCPRISGEILASGTPLLIRKQTRILKYYRDLDCVSTFNDDELEKIFNKSDENYKYMRQKNLECLNSYLSLDQICNMNLKLW